MISEKVAKVAKGAKVEKVAKGAEVTKITTFVKVRNSHEMRDK